MPIAALDGQEILTAEGLGTGNDLHPVQRAMLHGGSQCGYCTPGFVCSMAGEYYRPSRQAEPERVADDPAGTSDYGPNGFDLHSLSGNLCRCTGYRSIRDAAFALPSPRPGDPLADRRDAPPPDAVLTRVDGFVRPADLAEALALIADGATVIAGSTDWGVEVNLRGARVPLVAAIDRVPELRSLQVDPNGIEIGAALNLSELGRLLDGRIALLDQMLPQFASRLIRNCATIGGNLGTGSPVGDTAPVLLALEAVVVLASEGGAREVPMTDFFTGYRQSVRRPDELIRAVRIPLPLAKVTDFHKVAKRRFDDISSLAVAFAVDIEEGVVSRAAIGLGGVAATPIRAYSTEEVLLGQPWTPDTVRRAAAVMAKEGTPMGDHRASAAYRVAMLEQSLLRFYARNSSDGRAGVGTR